MILDKSQQLDKISIIMPVYNAEPYIKRTIESIQAQTYHNWELIIIDDGSNDQTFQVIKAIASEDQRILLLHKENGGASQARNYGLSNITGSLVAFIDDDDKFEPNFLEVLRNVLIEYKADVAMCNIIQNDGSLEFSWTNVDYFHNKEAVFNEYSRGGICNRIWNKLYRREVIENIFFEVNRTLGEDSLWTPRVIERVNSLVRVPQGYYHYFVRNDSLSHGAKIDERSQLEFITNSIMGSTIILKHATVLDGRKKIFKWTLYNFLRAVNNNLDFLLFNTYKVAQDLIIQNPDIYNICTTESERYVLNALETGVDFDNIVVNYRRKVLLHGSLMEKRKLIVAVIKRTIKKVISS